MTARRHDRRQRAKLAIAGVALMAAGASVRASDLDLDVGNGARVRAEIVEASGAVTLRCRLAAGVRLDADVRARSRGRTWTLRLTRASDGVEVASASGSRRARVRKLVVPGTGSYQLTITADGEGGGQFDAAVKWRSPRRMKFDAIADGGFLDVPLVADAGSTVRVRARTSGDAEIGVDGITGVTTGHDVEVADDSHRSSRKVDVRSGEIAVTDEYIARVAVTGATDARIRGTVRVRPPPRARGTAHATATDYSSQGQGSPLFGRVVWGIGGVVELDLPQTNGLRGCAVDVPATAIRRATPLAIGEGADLAAPTSGLAPAGKTVYFGPDGREFRTAIRVTITLDRDAVSGRSLDGIVVRRRDSDGTTYTVDRQLVTADADAATLTILTDDLATFRAFIPQSGPIGIGSPDVVGDQLTVPAERLGHSLSADADSVLVGAPETDQRRGSAYVYRRDAGAWTLDGTLAPAEASPFDEFGGAVALCATTAAVGARFVDGTANDEGACYVFERGDGEWTQTARLTADDPEFYDQFGGAVALCGDTLAVGARLDDDHGERSGSVYVFRRGETGWVPWQKLTAPDAGAGAELGSAISLHDATLAVGAPRADGGVGAVYVFQRTSSGWSLARRLSGDETAAEAGFGAAVCIRGDELVVGAPDGTSGAAYAFSRLAGIWQVGRRIATGPAVGVAVAVRGELAYIGAPAAASHGSVEVLRRTNGEWTRLTLLQSPAEQADDAYGAAVIAGSDAVFIGAPGTTRTDAGSGLLYVHPLTR